MCDSSNQIREYVKAIGKSHNNSNLPSRQSSPFKSAKANRLSLIYGNKSHYLETNKNYLSTKDRFGKTSSCLSSKVKYDYAGDVIQNNTYSLKTEQTSDKSKSKKPFRLIRSADKKTIKFTDSDLEKLFSRVSMHALKTKREVIEKNTKQLQSEYTYVLKKLDQFKKVRMFEQNKERKLQQVKKQQRNLSLQLKANQLLDHYEIGKHKGSLRNMVVDQRVRRKDKVKQKIVQNSLSASQVRCLQKQCHQELEKAQAKHIQRNRKKYLREKKEYTKRRDRIDNRLEQRKQKAKINYRRRWITELEKAQNVKEQFFDKRTQLLVKMKKIISSYQQSGHKKSS